jgi:hypothetical protein
MYWAATLKIKKFFKNYLLFPVKKKKTSVIDLAD